MKWLSSIFRWWYKRYETPSRFTKEEVLEIARKYHLEREVMESMKYGYTPDESLQEWDIYPYN